MFKHWKYNEKMIEIMHNILEPQKADDSIKKHTQILRVVKEALPITSPLSEENIQIAIKKANEYGLDAQNLKKAIESLKIN